MKTNHLLIPLGILSVIVAIWAALRKNNSNPTVIVQSSPSLNPGVTPLGAPAIDPYANPAPAPNVQTQAPSAAASGVPSYASQDVSGGGLIAAPKPAQNTPSFYGPVRDFINSMLPVSDPAPAPKNPAAVVAVILAGAVGARRNVTPAIHVSPMDAVGAWRLAAVHRSPQ
jgi:hypothetical protein